MGTTSHIAQVVCQSDFKIPKEANEVRVGQRFGVGAYFAEDINKSLHYAAVENGVQHILLCRALCGDMHYTEEENDTTAHEDALKSNKHSILANPKQLGPREFILFSEDQVYAEYILQIKVS